MAVGYVGGDPTKVDRVGDTMAGDLVLDDGFPAASEDYVAEHGGGGVGADLAAHEADTTAVHGIADTAALETQAGAAAKVTAHTGAADPHGDRAFATTAIGTHTVASDPHGDRAFATSAIATHTGAADPHGDRAYAAGQAAGALATAEAYTDTVVAGTQPLDADLTAIAGLAPTDGDVLVRASGGWLNRTVAQLKAALGLVKGDVGLGLVDNTADAGKPVSTAQAAADALNLKIAGDLGDLHNASTARTNLGLGTAATQASSTFDVAGAAATAQAAAQVYADGLNASAQPSPGPVQDLPRWLDPAIVVTRMQTGHGWLGSAGASLNDTADFCLGTQSAKMPTPGDGGTYKIEKTGLSLDTTGRHLRIRVKLDNPSHINTWRFLIANDTGYAASYSWDLCLAGESTTAYVTDGDWLTITLPFSSATTTGSPTRSGVVCMKLNTRDDNTGNVVVGHLQSVELVTEPTSLLPNGAVSLCFDDGFDSVWLKAKPKMDANGLRGTIFLIDDQVDQSGRLTTAQLRTLQEQGWEISAHSHTTASHTATYTGLTAAQLDTDLHAQAVALRAAGFRGQGIAYPQGVYGRTSDGQATVPYSRRYASYGRTVYRRTMETWPPADLMRLRSQSAISTFSGGYTPSTVSGVSGDLDKAKAAHAWFIATFHKVVASGAAATTEINQSDFDAIIDKIVSNGMMCAPVGELLGFAAVLPVGTAAGTVAAGDDSRFTDTRTPTDNSVTSAKIVDGTIVDADISGTAGIALSKLATNPVARANHTGTQLAATISDLAAAVAALWSAYTATGLVYGTIGSGIIGDGTHAVKWRTGPASKLELKGWVKVAANSGTINIAGSNAQTLFTLPVGSRPATAQSFFTRTKGTNTAIQLTVDTGGAVTCDNSVSTITTTGDQFPLDNWVIDLTYT